MRPAGAPETFAEWWQHHGQPYEAAVIVNGGTPWPFDPAKCGEIAERLGLPEDTDPMVLRRALWDRRNGRSAV